ncbi:MAG: sigma factor-like helix-turn-helix DNA-binding protein [Myxococcota bacterium]
MGDANDRVGRGYHPPAALAAARSAWPSLQIDGESFEAVMAQLADDGDLDPDDPTQAPTVGLAVACATGDRAALSAFEARYFGPVAAIGTRILGEQSLVEELEQRLRERLFVAGADDEAPRVVAVAGRGDMQSLVRVSATRLALNLRRGEGRGQRRKERVAREGTMDDALDDPELALLKNLDRTLVKDAFAAALAALEPGQRNLLRHHLVDHLSIDQIAGVYGVHRATAARRLNRARADVAAGTREFINAHAGEDVRHAALRQFVDSRLDLSLSRLLATSKPA